MPRKTLPNEQLSKPENTSDSESKPKRTPTAEKAGRKSTNPKYKKAYNKRTKLAAFNKYGGQCACCGEREPISLTISSAHGFEVNILMLLVCRDPAHTTETESSVFSEGDNNNKKCNTHTANTVVTHHFAGGMERSK